MGRKRSLKASEAGIREAELARTGKKYTNKKLADKVGICESTVGNFFRRKRVDKGNFVSVCEELGLSWEAIVEEQSVSESTSVPKSRSLEILTVKTRGLSIPEGPPQTADIETRIQRVHQKATNDIRNRCSTMRVLEMEQPIELEDIYTSVNILEKITGRSRLEIETLSQGLNQQQFDRFELGRIQQKRLSGLEAVERYSKLMILGKPGSGKTTFLKRLAILCQEGEFQAHRIPVFITLKEFAEAEGQPKLQNYIANHWAKCCHDDDVAAIAEAVLYQGRALVLLDGLDEVKENDHNRIIREIRNFSNQFCRCQFVITCRIAAQEYIFKQFTDVEIADFNHEQIEEFASKWFEAKQDSIKAKTFVQKLDVNTPIKELATNPLLLTLLCLVFGDINDFPRNRSELYKEGLDVLLKKWDAERNIERDQTYRNLSLRDKQGLLSQLAFQTFDKSEYFFKQRDIEAQIATYMDNLSDANTQPDDRQKDSGAVLKAIEAHHGLLVERARGIYSFSHLTFQEYFTANQIVKNPPSHALKALENLSRHITEKRWREVFLLTVEMLSSADDLLQAMSVKLDEILTIDEKLRAFLTWVQMKSESVATSYKPAAVRAFYFDLALEHDIDLELARALDSDLSHDLDSALDLYLCLNLDLTLDRDTELELARALDRKNVRNLERARARALDLALDRDLDRARTRALDLIHNRDRNLTRTLDLAIARTREPELKQALQRLKAQVPVRKGNLEAFKQWWQANGKTWVEKLRTLITQHRNIGHDWQFSDRQKEKLQQYYNANKLLVDCLNSDCYVTRSVRKAIEDTLLLHGSR